jgi:hypothetical protein
MSCGTNWGFIFVADIIRDETADQMCLKLRRYRLVIEEDADLRPPYFHTAWMDRDCCEALNGIKNGHFGRYFAAIIVLHGNFPLGHVKRFETLNDMLKNISRGGSLAQEFPMLAKLFKMKKDVIENSSSGVLKY